MKFKKNYFILIICVIVTVVFINYINKKGSNVGLVSITQEEISTLISNEEDAIIYVGRETCPDCKKVKPILLEELEKSNKSLYYFDTTSEGEELYKYRQFYNSLGVQSVPTIIVIKSGSIEKNIDLIKNPEKIPTILTILNEEF